LPGRGFARELGRGQRTLPGERLSGDRLEPSEASDPRRHLEVALRDSAAGETEAGPATRPTLGGRAHRPLSLFGFGVSRKRLEQAVRELGVPVTVARELDEADGVVTLRNYYRRKPSALRDAEAGGIPIYVLKTNTIIQMENLLASLFDLEADPSEAALRETAEAIGLVESGGRPIELAPQNAYIRRLQHQMAERSNLMSRSRGAEPNRRVQLLPDEGRAWR
jgi:hypothetical protein